MLAYVALQPQTECAWQLCSSTIHVVCMSSRGTQAIPGIFRYAVKTLMWHLGVEVEVLNMTDSANRSLVPSVDFLNRSAWLVTS